MSERKGIVHGLSNKDYHKGGQEVSNTALSAACRSMAHYQAYLQHGSDISEKTALDGNIIHCAILEPSEFEKRYIVSPKFDKRTTAGKAGAAEFEAEANGRELITQEQKDMALGVINNVTGHDSVIKLIEHGEPEASIFWNDSESGLDCRCRPDWLGIDIIMDVKSTDDARLFHKSVMQYGYHRQESFYREGCEEIGIKINAFYFLVVEKKPPFDFMIYEISHDLSEYGYSQWRKALNDISLAKFTGVYPGYGGEIKMVEKPSWIS